MTLTTSLLAYQETIWPYSKSYGIFDVDIFYSYSTCNATADDWLKVEEDFVDNNRFFGGIDLKM